VIKIMEEVKSLLATIDTIVIIEAVVKMKGKASTQILYTGGSDMAIYMFIKPWCI
jgi:hypothetical protein